MSEASADPAQLPHDARRAIAALLTNRFISRTQNGPAWQAILTYESEIREHLANMFLMLDIDREYEVAFKRQDPSENAPRVLRRDKPLSRDASLLLIHLRTEHLYADSLDEPVMITRAQVIEFLRRFREDDDGDEARLERRADAALNAVVDVRLLSQSPDAAYLYTVSPAIVPLINEDVLTRFESYFDRAGRASARPEVAPQARETNHA
ncbi:DUF4194 domain-containing protein [Micrococcales bacterium 31B]|nr:DUF4194 domain-containing protein [Micrococcales bacterium 31B]